MTRLKIKDRALMKERLAECMRKKGFVHQNGSPFQLKLAEASGVRQPMISALLSGNLMSIDGGELKKLAATLECQEQWLIGGAYIPPLFIEAKPTKETYIPEEKIDLRPNTGTTEPLWAIVRQLQRLNDNIESGAVGELRKENGRIIIETTTKRGEEHGKL